MGLTIYGIKNCDTMKKAMKWLDEQGIDYHFHDYKKEGVPESALQQWLDALGWETVINKRGTTWRNNLTDDEKTSMDAQKAVPVALENPSIVKRPILQNDNLILAGFNASEWAEKLN